MKINYKKTYAEKKAEKKAWLAGREGIARRRAAGEYDDMELIYEQTRKLLRLEASITRYNATHGPDEQIPPVIG